MRNHPKPLGYRESTLPNGLEVLTEYIPPEYEAKEVKVYLYVWSGAIHEKPGQYGLAHFVEHMSIGSSTKKNTRDQIAMAAIRKHIEFNAETLASRTRYDVEPLIPDLHPVIDLFLDQILDTSVLSSEVNTERGVVCEEIRRTVASPEDFLDLLALGHLFKEDPLSLYGLGREQDVAEFTRNHVNDFREVYYTPDNMTLVVIGSQFYSGTFKQRADRFHKEIVEAALRNFERYDLKNHGLTRPPVRYSTVSSEPLEYVHEPRDIPNVFLAKAYQNGVNGSMEEYLAAKVLTSILARRFCKQVREDDGTAYRAGFFYNPHPDHIIMCRSSCQPSDAQTLRDRIMLIQDKVSREIPNREFEDHRDGVMNELNDHYRLGTSRIRQVKDRRLGIKWTYSEMRRGLKQFSPRDVSTLAGQLFAQNHAEVTLGHTY